MFLIVTFVIIIYSLLIQVKVFNTFVRIILKLQDIDKTNALYYHLFI